MAISGLYHSVQRGKRTPAQEMELRLDVDGRFPQMVASGVTRTGSGLEAAWVARLKPMSSSSWAGRLSFKRGHRRIIPETVVTIRLRRGDGRPIVVAEFRKGTSTRTRKVIFKKASPYFHKIDVEFDHTSDVEPALKLDFASRSIRPKKFRLRRLTIPNIYERAGYRVTKSPGGLVPISFSGRGPRWSDQELNDAMENRWEHFANNPQWALWVFTTGMHELGKKVGGVMFDYRGKVQRQGSAVFNKSDISRAPRGHEDPKAWIQRMRFWTTCHEMGHCFNLAHSWEKSSRGTPWLPMRSDREARSFMNYPSDVRGGEDAFFQDFQFRFTDSEILFLRHAPESFVQMGHNRWSKSHGFVRTAHVAPPTFQLKIRANRDAPRFEFLEPVVLELKLINVSSTQQEADQSWLGSMDRLEVVIQRKGYSARRFLPYVRYHVSDKRPLPPGKALYEPLFVAAGADGWYLTEPGSYSVQAFLRLPSEDVVSNELHLTIGQRRGAEEEKFAQDFFSLDVGRVLVVDGSRVLDNANATLTRAIEEFPNRRAAVHAQVALGCPQAVPAKVLRINGPNDLAIVTENAHTEIGHSHLNKALVDRAGEAVETLGHIDYKLYVDWFTDQFLKDGRPNEARKLQETLLQTMSGRKVRHRPIVSSVLDSITAKKDQCTRAATSR